MKKFLTLFMISLLCLILDNSVAPFFSIKTFYPSFVTVFIISYAIINGSIEGLWVGVLCGLLQDIYFFKGFGVNALANMVICVLAGELGTNIFKEKSFIPMISTFLLSLLKGIILFIILYLCKTKIVVSNILYSSIYNMFVSLIIYKFIYKLCNKECMQRKWKF